MAIEEGHGLLLIIPNFADGTPCGFVRPFFVVETRENEIVMLNVSSVKGKEVKAMLPTNVVVADASGFFKQASFVKVDSLYVVESFDGLEKALLRAGRKLDAVDCTLVKTAYENLVATNPASIRNHRITAQELQALNPSLR